MSEPDAARASKTDLVPETFRRPSFEQAFPPRAADAESAMREGIAERQAKKLWKGQRKPTRLAEQNRGQHLARRQRREYSKEEQDAKIELNKYQLRHERQQKFERQKRREEAAERDSIAAASEIFRRRGG